MMKFYFILFVLIAFQSYGQQDSSIIEISELHISHYSSRSKELRISGHITEDSTGAMLSKSMFCIGIEDSTIFYYRLTKYYPSGIVKYDSIVDLRKKRIGESAVYNFNSKGERLRLIEVRAKLDPKRTDIPVRSETIWNGKVVEFDPESGKREKRKLSGIRF